MTRGFFFTFLSSFPILVGPSGICEEASCAKKRIKKQSKVSISIFHNASPHLTAEPALHVAKSSDVSAHILHNIPDTVAWERYRYEEARNRLT